MFATSFATSRAAANEISPTSAKKTTNASDFPSITSVSGERDSRFSSSVPSQRSLRSEKPVRKTVTFQTTTNAAPMAIASETPCSALARAIQAAAAAVGTWLIATSTIW